MRHQLRAWLGRQASRSLRAPTSAALRAVALGLIVGCLAGGADANEVQTPNEVQKLANPDNTNLARFGRALLLWMKQDETREQVVVVGARSNPLPDDGATVSFQEAGPPGPETYSLREAPTIGDALEEFGFSMAGDELVVVGAPGGGGDESGRAHLFERAPAGWQDFQTLALPIPSAGDRFGESVAIAGDVVAVGVVEFDAGQFTDNGGVAIFRRDADTFVFHQTILPTDTANNKRFGSDVALGPGGNVILVGAMWDEEAGSQAGAGYVFEYSPTHDQWLETRKLLPGDAGPFDAIGERVALSTMGPDDIEVAALSARGDDEVSDAAGAVYFYTRQTSWTEEQKLLPEPGTSGFGADVALDDARLLAGVTSGDPVLYGFSSLATFESVGPLTPSFTSNGSQFGRAVALGGDRALVGAPLERADNAAMTVAGAVFVFDVPEASAVASTLAAICTLAALVARSR